MTLADLRTMHCSALKGPKHALPRAQIDEWHQLLPAGWEIGTDARELRKRFEFRDFAGALAFVNALAWIAERENHHPDLELGWGRCIVRFSTHDVGGLSRNDFICAAKTEMLLSA